MSPSFARIAVVLGLLSAVGPFAVDMYLPALPAIASDLHASTTMTQLTLTAYFVAFGMFQIVYGPLSDAVGRRPPLFIGLSLFAAGSIGCGLAPSVGWLIACRMLQGVGAAAITVMPRAVIRDLYTGVEATRLMSMVMLVFSVSPILAPLTGSALIVPFGWRAVFAGITVIALLGLLLVATLLPETRLPKDRVRGGLGTVLSGFAKLLCDWEFLGLSAIAGFGIGGFFAFLASSSFVFIEHFGLTPTQYSLAFSLNAVGFIATAQFAAPIGERLGLSKMVTAAAAFYACSALILLALTLAGVDSLVVLMALLFVIFSCLGPVMPSTMVLALERHGPIAGLASALSGTLQMIVGGSMIALVGIFADGSALPMVATIALSAALTLAVTIATLRRRASSVQAAE
jgi:DHA1 family bicyclomycin/chloramphenicol resistance-like MFS transporter